jgi:hypothetical protein
VTLAEWLDSRTPRPPDALEERIHGALAPVLDHEVEAGRGSTHHELLAAARSLLSAQRAADSAGRGEAHDLLAADALVTYAFELAAEDPDAVDTLAESAMRYFGSLAGEGGS